MTTDDLARTQRRIGVAGAVLLLAALPALEPRREHLAQGRKPWLAAALATGAVLLVEHGVTVAAAMGHAVSVERAIPSRWG